MYNNSFIIEIKDKEKFSILTYSLNESNREMLYDLLLDFVPLKIRKIIPTEQGYNITWTDKDQFDIFVNDSRYSEIISLLNQYDILINWIL